MSNLGSFLDVKPSTKKTSAATVGGNTPEGEVYIRADGKKVRRVKKVVKRAPSDTNSVKRTPSDKSLTAEGKETERTRGLKPTSSSSSLASVDAGGQKNNLGSFLGSGNGSRKTGSATVAGDINLTSSSLEDGEIYIRADGKKVRRVRKVGRSSSGSVGPSVTHVSSTGVSKDEPLSSEQATASPPNASKPKKDLGSFLNRQSGTSDTVIKKASKSVSGRSASGQRSVSGVSAKSKDSEFYINKDGKKVRRVKKSSASVGDVYNLKSRSGDSVSGDSATSGKLKITPGDIRKSRSGDSVSGDSATSGKLKVTPSSMRLDASGKPLNLAQTPATSKLAQTPSPAKLNNTPSPSKSSGTPPSSRLESSSKSVSSTNSSSKLNELGSPATPKASTGGLGGFLENGDRPLKKPSRLASASVAGSTPATQGDVYIRADGKKVRRVRKPSSSSSVSMSSDDASRKEASLAKEGTPQEGKQSALSSFLGNGTSPSRKSGSATVAGDGRNVSSNSSVMEGEIYIRPDGKKVRRVRKTPAIASAAATTATNGGSAGLGSFLSKSVDGCSPKASGSATVTGATSTPSSLLANKKSEEGEIYINKDGKKVRRVRRTANTSQSNAGDLAGFLDKPGTPLGGPGASVGGKLGSASVAGSNPTQDGEIYIRPDGKKVRRVRRSPSGNLSSASSLASPVPKDNTPPKKAIGQSDGGRTLSALLDGKPRSKALDGSESIYGAATVAGDRIIKSTEEGEIVIRADGKKVRRIRKTREGAASQEGEVYRRADGKLVRRVRKSAANGDAAPSASNSSASETVQVDPTPAGPVSKLSSEDEKTAETYRKMLTMGLPDDAVKHKMSQDGVGPLIIQSVLNREVPAQEHSGSAGKGAASSVPVLSEEEEASAGKFRKMLKMGLPEDAVRQKMAAEGLDRKVISAVLGDEVPAPLAQPPTTLSNAAADGLSDEEKATIARFRKMLKMGLPGDAIKHKMVVEGLDAKVINAVFSADFEYSATSKALATPESGAQSVPSSSLTDDEELVAARFRRMLNMGLPGDAVEHKMTSEGVNERIISAVLNPASDSASGQASAGLNPSGSPSVQAQQGPSSSLTAEEEAVASRFQKMLAMGLPRDAVLHKMVAEGVQENIINFVLDATGDASSPSSPVAPTPVAPATVAPATVAPATVAPATVAPATVAPATVAPSGLAPGTETREVPQSSASVKQTLSPLSDDEEAIAAKYRKMLQMGMPEEAVNHKMSMDGVDPRIAFVVVGSPASSPLGGTGSTILAPAGQHVGAAYVVVVSDDSGPAPPIATAADIKSRPDDKFTVSVGDGQGGKGTKKLMSLDEIANATGQSKEELEKMVKEKQEKGEGSSFILNHVGGQQRADSNLFEVEVPPMNTGPAMNTGPPMDPSKKYSEIGDGQEVVDSKLAEAARAVAALGDMDMKALLTKLQAGDMELLINKLQEAEKRQKKLEKQLAQAGVAIAEDIDYSEAKSKVEEIAKRMGEIGGSDVTVADKEEQNRLREEYFKLEQEMERYNTALMLSEEYQAEQDRIEKKWENDNAPLNEAAIKKIRRHMPVKIRHMSEADLTNTPSPNGKFLPTAIAKKFKRTNVLQCLRLNPDDLERMHPSTLENMRVTGLTLTERRALYCHLKSLGPKWEKNKSEKMTERKWTWYQMMKNNFKENVAPYDRHVLQYGPPENHQCPLLGKQCPIKADKIIDYDGDYGWTDQPEYEVSDVKKADTDDPGAKAMLEALELAREKKANERADILKKHYKGKLLQVSKANGSCEAMDEAMDRMENHTIKWLENVISKGDTLADADKGKEVASITEAINELKLSVLDFAQRSGMQMSGKKKAGGDAEDIRSVVEGGLAEEVFEASQEFFGFIKKRMNDTGSKDTRIEKTLELLEGMLSELHSKNVELFDKLGLKRPDRSRKLKKVEELKKEVEEKMKPKEEAPPPEAAPTGPPMGRPPNPMGRGGLLDAIAGGRGRGRGRDGGGRGGLLDAIAGRGAKGPGGGRGGLLDAIAGARGKGRGGDCGGGDGGARGGLLAAIQGRGGGGGDGGGARGGLLAAIQARGGG